MVGHWYGKRPEILENRDLDLAVARGAAYYSYVRSTGSGVLVRGGLPRTYYIGLGRTRRRQDRGRVPGAARRRRRRDARNRSRRICNWWPTGPCRSGSTARSRAPKISLGDVVEFAAGDESLHTHAPLQRRDPLRQEAGERLIPVKLGARLTEIGTLETWCESKISDNRWRLQFELRKARRRAGEAPSPPRWSARRR